MFGLDLRLRRGSAQSSARLSIFAGFVHLADLVKLVRRRDRRLSVGSQPGLLEQHVIAGVGRKLRTVLAVELHVADGPVDDPGRQTVRQPLQHGLVHSLRNRP